MGVIGPLLDSRPFKIRVTQLDEISGLMKNMYVEYFLKH